MNEKKEAGNGQGNETKHGEVRLSTGGVFDSIDLLGEAIKAFGEKYNILVPGGAIGGKMPLLHAAAMSFVFVDAEKDTYAIPGSDKRAIGKMALGTRDGNKPVSLLPGKGGVDGAAVSAALEDFLIGEKALGKSFHHRS